MRLGAFFLNLLTPAHATVTPLCSFTSSSPSFLIASTSVQGQFLSGGPVRCSFDNCEGAVYIPSKLGSVYFSSN